MSISITKIAMEAGVSRMTVSRTLDARLTHKVKPSTRERVLEVCRRRGYMPSNSARSLARGKTLSIGMVFCQDSPFFSSPTHTQMFNAIAGELRERNYNLQALFCPHWRDIDEYVLENLYSRSVDTLLINTPFLKDATIDIIAEASLPAVTFSMPSDPIPSDKISCVRIDNEKPFLELLQLLVERGGRHIAYISQIGNQAYRGRIDTLRQLACNFPLEFSDHDLFNIPSKGRALQAIYSSFEFVESNFDELSQRDIWIFGNDLLAAGGIHALRRRGLEPGCDVSVVGYDNIENNLDYACEEPEITTVCAPFKQFGKTVVEVAFRQIENGWATPEQHTIDAKLIVRKSLNSQSVTTGGML